MTRVLRFLPIVVLAVAAAFSPSGATACACGDFKGVVVAHGSSLYRAPWRIKAVLPREAGPKYAMFEFSVGEPRSGTGYFTSLPRPIPPSFVLTGTPGSDFDEFPEADISGVTDGRVARLRVELTDGAVLESEPLRAPGRFRKRFPWLRGLRFYDVFFPEGQEATRVTALDARGKVLDRL